MIFRRGILGLAGLAALASASASCGSDIDDEGGNGGTSGTSGGTDCFPKAEICYGNRPATSPGNECLAAIDNTEDGTTLKSRVQFRQTWSRVIAPIGNTTPTVYGVLKDRANIRLPECFMAGAGGYIQMSDWDRSVPLLEQTVRTGYASYSNLGGGPPGAQVVSDGLCFIEWNYIFNGPASTPPWVDTWRSRWPETRPQQAGADGWEITPTVSTRVAEDFTLEEMMALNLPEGEGRIYINEETGFIHGYSPLTYVTVLDDATKGLATPIRHAEVRSQFNDGTFNCAGRYRADKMSPAQSCDPKSDQTNPQWGCEDDNICPPPSLPAPTTADPPAGGVGPSFTRGYFLIIDLERVWSSTLQSTLCVSYPGGTKSQQDGWSKPTNEGGWGSNCRGAVLPSGEPKWDPEAPNDAGLPMGNWCSRGNKPADENCHDAYLSESYSTAQAFQIQDGTCPIATP